MNKKEWRTHYSAARLLKNARFSRFESSIGDNKIRPEQKLVWDITYSQIQQMHESIGYAVWGCKSTIYKLKENRWAIKHNSQCFKTVREGNYLDRLERRVEE
jgi:hypothetical protein